MFKKFRSALDIHEFHSPVSKETLRTLMSPTNASFPPS